MDLIAERILELRGESNRLIKKNYSYLDTIDLENKFRLYRFNSKGIGLNKFVLSIPTTKEFNFHIFHIPYSISGFDLYDIIYDKSIDKLILKTKGVKRRINYEWDYKDYKKVFTKENLEICKSYKER